MFSGTFSKSARMEGNALKPLPLVSSRGCGTEFINYQLVMRARITNSDGDLDLGFSSDYGETYYTDEKDCPVSYIGSKQLFQDSAFSDAPSDTGHLPQLRSTLRLKRWSICTLLL